MREKKYRACISPTTVIYFTLDDLVNPASLFSIRELVIPWLRAGNNPDDYTGLKDKNGVEIFEGDILKTTSELMTHFGERGTGKYQTVYYSIEYDETRAQFKECKIETGYLLPLGLSQDIISKYSEVIGNIYEHPELLEVKI